MLAKANARAPDQRGSRFLCLSVAILFGRIETDAVRQRALAHQLRCFLTPDCGRPPQHLKCHIFTTDQNQTISETTTIFILKLCNCALRCSSIVCFCRRAHGGMFPKCAHRLLAHEAHNLTPPEHKCSSKLVDTQVRVKPILDAIVDCIGASLLEVSRHHGHELTKSP